MFQINSNNLSLFCGHNGENQPEEGLHYKGIVLEFHGLGDGEFPKELPRGTFYREHALLCIRPYDNPWSWMNPKAVETVDAILDGACEKYNLSEKVPVVSTGGSMGGLSALVFSCYSRHRIVACAADSPVCDLEFHFTERPDLPRTLYSAFSDWEELCSRSPVKLVKRLPKIPYYIVHGTADTAVNPERHSDILVSEMEKYGYDVRYDRVPGMTHCNPPPENAEKYLEFIISNF
jgi:pimeloyl-ACP methyl ester carboxylesterase